MGPKRGWRRRWKREGATLIHRGTGAREADLCWCKTVPVAQRVPGGGVSVAGHTEAEHDRWRHVGGMALKPER